MDLGFWRAPSLKVASVLLSGQDRPLHNTTRPLDKGYIVLAKR